MIKTDSSAVFAAWNAKEAALGKRISIREAAREMKLSIRVVTNFRNGTSSISARVLNAFCAWLGVAPGPVPFLVYVADDSTPRARGNKKPAG